MTIDFPSFFVMPNQNRGTCIRYSQTSPLIWLVINAYMELPSDASNIPLVARGQLCGLNEVKMFRMSSARASFAVLSNIVALFFSLF